LSMKLPTAVFRQKPTRPRLPSTFRGNDTPPTLDGVPDVTAPVGDTVTVSLSSYMTEPDGDTVTYSATGLPDGLTLDSATGEINGSVSTAGTYTVTATATDKDGSDSDTFTIDILEVVENADDLCYEDPISSGMFCFDMGICSGGLGCRNTYPLKNIGDSDLTDVHAIYDETNLVGGTFGDSCGVDPSGTCSTVHDIDMGPFGFFDSATKFNLDNPIPPADNNNAIWTENFVSGSCFSGESLYGTYIKDGVYHRGKINPCTDITPTYEYINDAQCGIFPSVLTSYTGIVTQKNDVTDSCTISVANENLTEDTAGNNDLTCVDCSCNPATSTCSENETCTVVPEPDTRLDYTVYETTVTDSYSIDKNWNDNDNGATEVSGSQTALDVTFKDLEYGDYYLSQDVSTVNFSPEHSYSDVNVSLMLLGDIRFSGNGQTVTFEGGDYYFESFKIDKDTNGNINQIDICAKDDIRIFVKGDFVYSGNHLNDGECGGKIFIYVEGNAEIDANGGGSGDLPVFLYTKGDVDIENSGDATDWFGAITAEGNLNITGENINFQYDPDGYPGYGECCIRVEFAKDHYDIAENINEIGTTKNVYPVIVLSHAADYDINVTYHTQDGTAKVADGDYVGISSETVTIPAGETNVSIPITIYNDAPIELQEEFYVYLNDPGEDDGYCLGDLNPTQINILAQEDAPVCFEDDFSNGLDDKWRVLKADGGFTPQVVQVGDDYRLRLTPAENHIATAITKDYEFSTTQNLIIVEFDYYAYGGDYVGSWAENGADGVANVLFDSLIGGDSPEPGAMGGSLGYAQKDTTSDGAHPGFQGGWLGLGMDEYGNYSNPTEGRNGGPGFRPNAVAIRGDGNYSYGTPATYEQQGYEYLEGVQLDDNEHPLADRAASDYYSGRYKMTVDARDPDHLYITLERSVTGDPNDYVVIIDRFDAKDPVYNQGKTPDLVRYAITASTGGANNIHEISWIKLRGNCAVYGATSYVTGPFDAWDTFRGDTDGDGTVNDRNISTKIAGKPFQLTIGSLTADGEHLEPKADVNAKYALYYFDSDDNEIAYDGNFYDFNASSESTITSPELTVAKAYQRMYVRIQYCADMNDQGDMTLHPYGDCPASPIEWEGTLSTGLKLRFHRSDMFAVRPNAFWSDLGATYIADRNSTIQFVAADYNNQPTPLYNEADGSTFTVQTVLSDPTLDCTHTSTDLVPSLGFNDGNGTKDDYRFTRIGDYNLTVQEKDECNLRYAYIDCDDQNITGEWNTESDLAITPFVKNNLHIVPAQFSIENVTYTNYQGGAFTYLSDLTIDKNMTSQITLTLRAVKDSNDTAENYTDGCFGHDFKLTFAFNGAPSGLTLQMYDTNTSTAVTTGGERTFGAAYFPKTSKGNITLSLFVNFDRNSSATVNPFDHNLTQVDANDTVGLGGSTVPAATASARFYYGRLHAPSYTSYNTTVNTPIYAEVYANLNDAQRAALGMSGWKESVDDINWWINPGHTNTYGAITGLRPEISFSTNPDPDVTATAGSADFSSGVKNDPAVTYNGTALPHPVKIFIDTAAWLKYHQYITDPSKMLYYDVTFTGNGGWHGVGNVGKRLEESNATKGGGVYERLMW